MLFKEKIECTVGIDNQKGEQMANGVWSGHLNLALLSIPVRLVPGARSEGISFNQLHRDDLLRVKQKLVCSGDGVELSRGDILKGYEFRKDEYVVISPEEIEQVEPKTTKTMDILQFVSSDQIDSIFFDSSYYIVPEAAGYKPYTLLTKAMESGKFFGIAKLAMHNREYTVVIRPYRGIHFKDKPVLALHTIFYPNEIREHGIHLTEEPNPKEVDFALKLIESMSDEWNPEDYTDEFQAALKQLIQSKIEGKPAPKVEKEAKKSVVPDILEALRLSMVAMEGKKKEKKSKK